MKIEFDEQKMTMIDAMWADPYGVAAKFVFFGFCLLLFVLSVVRHKMSIKDAALALVGFKRVTNRDLLFNLLHVAALIIPLILMMIAIQRVI